MNASDAFIGFLAGVTGALAVVAIAFNFDPPQTFPAAGCFELRTTDSTRVGEGPDAIERWQTVERIEWGCP